MKKQYQLKYKNFQYTNVIKNKLKYKLKGSEEEKFKSVYNQLLLSKGKYNISLNIAEDVFKLIYIYKFPTILLAEIYEVSKRSVELWAKDLMLTKKQLKNDINYINRKDEFKEFKDKCKNNNFMFIGEKYNKWTILEIDYCKSFIKGQTYFICRCSCEYKNIKSIEKPTVIYGYSKGCGCNMSKTNVIMQNDEFYDKDYCLYRFLDKNKNILYIGKCEKSFHANGRGGKKEYFIKDRIQHHYSPSSKQLPKSLYLNTKYIEVSFPEVKNNDELEKIEAQLISYYERVKFQCNYNLNLPSYVEYINEDTQEWKLYDEKSDKYIEQLLISYGMKTIPPIEIINERLRAIMWAINKK